MGKVTYKIDFAKKSPLGEEIKQNITKYQNVEHTDSFQKADIAVQIAELYFDQCDELDETMSEKDQKRIEKESLKNSLGYSEIALVEFRASNNKEQQARALMNMSRCYQKLNKYGSAILNNKEALMLYQDYNETDKYTLQSGFRLLGNLYFSKGMSQDAATFDDFSNAYKFYEKEHRIIKSMTAKDVDDDPNTLEVISQACYFNMGVIGCQLPEYNKEGLTWLAMSLNKAQKLKLYQSEKDVYWELAKVYEKRGKKEMVKQCRERELELAIRNHNKEDEMICLHEKIKTHLGFGEYPICYALYETLVENIDYEDDDNICDSTMEMITTIEELSHALDKTKALPRSPASIAQTARLYHDLGQTQFEYKMFRAALEAATQGLAYLEITEKKGPLCIIYASLFELKAMIQWELKESGQNEYLALNEELLEYIKTNIEQKKIKVDYSIPVYKRLVAIHRYFKKKDIAESWDSILSTAEEDFEALQDEQDYGYDPMDVDILETSGDDDKKFDHLEMSNMLLKSTTKDVPIHIQLAEPVTILIHVRSIRMTYDEIKSEVSKRTWELYGVEPSIRHFSINHVQISPNDLLDNIIKNTDAIIEAEVKGTVERPYIDCYKNACTRLKVTQSSLIKTRLHQQRTGTLDLSGLEITNNQLAAIRELLFLAPVITRLDLSSNLLCDEDLKILLRDIRSPRELILSNNRLTVESISTLLEMKNQRLKTLCLSYNPLGANILLELPMLLKKFRMLEVLEMEGTELGQQLDLDSIQYDDLSAQTDQIIMNRKLCINIRNNHFQGNMLSQWTCKWQELAGIDALQMSGVTSDEEWESFHQLSNFKWLKKLDFSRTVKGVLNIQALANIFLLGSNLHHLDLSYCDLTAQDIDVLCNGLDFDLNLKSLVFKSNPQLGDEGIQRLQATDLRHLSILNISDCGVTSKSIDTIIEWIWNSKFSEFDVSKNKSLIQTRGQLVHLIENYPRERMFIFNISLDEDISLHDLDLPTGLKAQKNLMNQTDPFS